MEYIWDEEKRITNLRKHHFDFKDAGSVFNDPHGVETVDDRFDYGEERIIRIGLYRGAIVTVVIFVENGNKCRIISFRKATKTERREYYHGNR